MMMKSLIVRISQVSFASLLILALGCNAGPRQLQTIQLPSGDRVGVLSEMTMHFSNESPALMLKYQTQLHVSDRAATRREADELWTIFKPEVEKGNFDSAILSANEVPTGTFIQNSNTYNFVYRKQGDGTWLNLADKKTP